MKRNTVFTIVLVVFSMLFITACGSKGYSDEDRITVAMSTDASSLDPNNFNTDYSDMAMRQVYDTLLKKDAEGKLVNSLAKSVEEIDSTTYHVALREGVTFHNGEALTADDVIFSLDRIAHSEKYGHVFEPIDTENLKKIDDLNLEIKLKEPSGTFLETLSHPGASILNKKAVEEDKIDLSTEAVGTGPFILEEWKKNDSLTYKAFEDYWGEKPSFSQLVIRIIPEANNRVVELESGGVDVALDLTPESVEMIQKNKDLTLKHVDSYAVTFLGFNVEKAPFDNADARRAIAHALDMDSIVKNVFKETGTLATGVVNPNVIYSISKSLTPAEYNPELAKELLKKAGVEEGTTLQLYVTDDKQRADIATIMQEQLSQVGLNVEIHQLEWNAYAESLVAQKDNFFLLRWNPSIVDPDQYLYPSFSTNTKGEGPNYGFYGNEELDVLMEEGRKLTNSPEREEIYKQAQEFVAQDLPWIPIAYGQQLIGVNKKVKEFTVLPTYPQDFRTIQLKTEE